jgi:subtilisin-like proprotein convertase family protein
MQRGGRAGAVSALAVSALLVGAIPAAGAPAMVCPVASMRSSPGWATSGSVTFSGLGQVRDVNVFVDLDMRGDGWIVLEDLELTLRSPQGLRTHLAIDDGGGTEHLTGTVFDDEAAMDLQTGAPPYRGPHRPSGLPLSRFDGLQADGTWTLLLGGDAHSAHVDSWGVDIAHGSNCTAP